MMAVNLKNDLRSSWQDWSILENKLALKHFWSLKGRKSSLTFPKLLMNPPSVVSITVNLEIAWTALTGRFDISLKYCAPRMPSLHHIVDNNSLIFKLHDHFTDIIDFSKLLKQRDNSSLFVSFFLYHNAISLVQFHLFSIQLRLSKKVPSYNIIKLNLTSTPFDIPFLYVYYVFFI